MASDKFVSGLLVGLGVAAVAGLALALLSNGASSPALVISPSPQPRRRFDGSPGPDGLECHLCAAHFVVTPLLQRWISLGAPPLCRHCLGRVMLEYLERG